MKAFYYLWLCLLLPICMLPTHAREFEGSATTNNQASVGRVLDQSRATTAATGIPTALTPTITTILAQPIPQRARSLQLLTGQSIQHTIDILMLNSQQFNRGIIDQLEKGAALSFIPSVRTQTDDDIRFDSERLSMWVNPFAGFGRRQSETNSEGYSFDTRGAQGGFDYAISDQLIIGLGLGHGSSDASVFENRGDSQSSLTRAAPYAMWRMLGFYVMGSASAGVHEVNGSRRAFDTDTANRQYQSRDYTAFARVGKNFVWGRSLLHVFFHVDYHSIREEAFSETELDGVALKVAARDIESMRTTIGVHYGHMFNIDRVKIYTEVRVSWMHEYMNRSQDVNLSFAKTADTDFTIRTADPIRDVGMLQIHTTIFLSGIKLKLNYHGEMSEKHSNHMFNFSANFNF